jgi:2,4'-dihydroxyacetophenone dioxygenase
MSYEDPRKSPDELILPGEVRVDAEAEWRNIGTGVDYKLLYLDETCGRWSALFHMAEGAVLKPHIHKGAVETYMIRGKIEFRTGRSFKTGDYVYEPLGAVHHHAVAVEDAVVFNVMHGPVEFFDENGETTLVWDWEWVKRELADDFKGDIAVDKSEAPA